MKKLKGLTSNNFFWCALFLLLQIAYLAYFLIYLSVELPALNIILRSVSLIFVIHILNKPMNPAYKIAWIIPILVFPLFGMAAYVFLRNHRLSRKNRSLIAQSGEAKRGLLKQNQELLESVGSPMTKKQAERLFCAAQAPIAASDNVEYFDSGEKYAKRLIEELEKAQRFIFMEFFIISKGAFWDRIEKILERKACSGVDVRIIFDDVGSQKLPKRFIKNMARVGVSVCRFNPFRPFFNMQMNNRSHRKLVVIDGKVAFTGGMNIADEYINLITRFGHWKDAGIVFDGAGVDNFTQAFLELWNMFKPVADYRSYVGLSGKASSSKSLVVPFTDFPADYENVTQDMYLQMIYGAEKYVYFFTPYLIIDNEMRAALLSSKKSGVDVRVVVPHIPDKKIVFELTKVFYSELVENGISVYEYSKGFIHSKVALADNRYAYVGSCNLDFRSLFLHLECGVYLDSPEVAKDIKDDFDKTFAESKHIKKSDLKTGRLRAVWRSILRVFAPLM